MKEIVKYSNCFVCGDKNEAGLQIKFYATDEGAIAEYTAGEYLQGYKGILHGGIISTLLDEIMAKAVLADDVVAVTAEMTTRFKKPVQTGEKLALTGRILKQRGRMYATSGEVRREDGTVVASATGKYLIVPRDFESALLKSLDG